jgi:AcrR family transcriptional regulator
MARPRDHDIDDRIIAAAAQLVDRSGAAGLSVAEVARRAGVSRPSVYRRFPTLAALLFELQTRATVPPAMPDLGSLAAELSLAVEHLVATLAASDRSLAADQLAAIINDPTFAATVRERRWNPDRELVLTIWRRAVARGEVSSAVDGAAVIDDIVGIALFRVLLLHEPPSKEQIATMVDRLLHGVLQPPN